MSNTENDTVMMLNPEQCSRIIFWSLCSKVINNAVRIDVSTIKQLISICSSNPLLEQEMILLQLILKLAEHLTDETTPFITNEVPK